MISRSGYWARQQQLLITIAADEDRESRARAIRHIRAVRERAKQEQMVRSFTLPTVNYRPAMRQPHRLGRELKWLLVLHALALHIVCFSLQDKK